MSYEMTGTLLEKFDVVQRSATFKIREFVLERSEDFGGKTVTNYIKFQSTQDRTGIIDKINKGDQIRVHFNIRGSKWEKNGQISYFNNLDAWRVEQVLSAGGNDAATEDLPGPENYNNSFDDGEEILPF